MKQDDLIVIGGGAAGLTAAGLAAREGLKVRVLETRERPARKILVTGKGRCNLTNNCSPEDFLKNVRQNPKFLTSAIWGFPPSATMELFESLGVPLKTERGNRVFPVSDSARNIVDALTRLIRQGDVSLVCGKVSRLLLEDGRAVGAALEDGREFRGQAVLLATGGKSYPATGSDGSGYELARQAGHTITPLRPSLIPILCRESCCADMMGLSLKNVTLTLWEEGKKKPLYSELGEMLFTHFGVSGPLVLSASSYMKGPADRYRLTIDLKPGLTLEQLDARLLRDLGENPNKALGNLLGLLLPRTMVPAMLRAAELPGELKANQVTRAQRQRLEQLVKAFPLTPKGLRPIEEAVVTSGGVSVREVDPSTMASKLCPGLYFAGEVLDVDAYTGGYNLQIAFSTAWQAAQAILEKRGMKK